MLLVREKAKGYEKELGKVVRSFDVDRFKGFIEKHKGYFNSYYFTIGKDDEWFLGCMAKIVMNRNDMSVKDKEKAKEILDKLGWDYEVF